MSLDLLEAPARSSQSFTSVTGRNWQLRAQDERAVLALMQRLQLPEVVARILAGRDISLEEAPLFLNPTLRELLPDPFHLQDMERAANRLADAVIAQESIVIFGDYDVDGATSSSLLKRFLASVGLDAGIYIPDRMTEGYGPNSDAMRALSEQGAKIIVTVDCGTLAFEPFETAAECGLEVIVLDHHLGSDTLPKALAIVNPNRLDETSPYRYLAAVGVTFLTIIAVNRILRERGYYKEHPEPNLMQWLDLVALGTVCDVVPLKGLNRAFVTQGLKILAKRQNQGLAALMDVASINSLPSTYHLGYILGPRINAGGRVGQADLGSRLLTTTDRAQSITMATRLDHFNAERKAIEMLALDEAMLQAASLPEDMPCIVVSGEGWHQGVIGIVAGRIKERFHKPCAVIALSNGIGKGSARSVQGFDIGSAIVSARELQFLEAGGGHTMAAGFTVKQESIPALTAFLCERATQVASEMTNITWCDGYLALKGVSVPLVTSLEQIGPFGAGNAQPRFILSDVSVIKADIVGGKHIRCILGHYHTRQHSLKAMAFQAVDTPLADILLQGVRQPLHMLGTVVTNEWQGNVSAEFRIEDVAV